MKHMNLRPNGGVGGINRSHEDTATPEISNSGEHRRYTETQKLVQLKRYASDKINQGFNEMRQNGTFIPGREDQNTEHSLKKLIEIRTDAVNKLNEIESQRQKKKQN